MSAVIHSLRGKANQFVSVNSTELHAQSSPNTDYISPITLSYVEDTSQFRTNNQPQLPDMHLPHHMPASHDTASAPANVVFDTSPPMPLPSPGDLDFDLSPLSPWMDAYKPDTSHQARRIKRTASPPEDEQAKVARRRPSPMPRVPSTPNSTKQRARRGTKSASSTPLLRSSRAGGHKNSASVDVPGDTPSPVDLSMPPPGPPVSLAQPEINASSSSVNVQRKICLPWERFSSYYQKRQRDYTGQPKSKTHITR